MFKFLFLIAVIVWSISTGFREGTMWSTRETWKNNLPLDYHSWRSLEYFSIAGMILAYQGFFWFGLGAWLFGVFLPYERSLHYISYGELYHPQGVWKCLDIEIDMKNWQMNVVAGLGVLLMILTFVWELEFIRSLIIAVMMVVVFISILITIRR